MVINLHIEKRKIMKFSFISLILLTLFNNAYAGTYSEFVDDEIPFLTEIIMKNDDVSVVRESLNVYNTWTEGLKAIMVQSNFTLCKVEATSRYGISKLDSGPGYAPQLKKWRKSTINDNGTDMLSFTDIHHDYQHVIFCKKYNTGDSYKIEIKHCTTDDDPVKKLKKMEGSLFPGCRK